ncbi:hypothetical protein CYY_004521 [Polysphondylium violaceum]|uniref:Uncharacterized protein n=1 Tax=Polysphondylium violaceum TaxID=133409 RepID=A0A8J4V521_9MYCE|nr:hypothetical protein CYY_004521 [Polysphondylium violaceum]
MYKHNHIGLLKEKLNSNKHLYIDPLDLFTTIANSDTELFITLFQRYKYSVLKYYYEIGFSDIIRKLNNIDVVRYLFESGYGKEIRSISFDSIDINLLEYYLENQWLKASIDIFTDYQEQLRETNRTARIDLKDKIELVVKYIESNPDNLYQHPEQLFGTSINIPVPSLIRSIYHLLPDNDDVHIVDETHTNHQFFSTEEPVTFQRAVNKVQESEDILVRLKTAAATSSNDDNVRLNFYKYSMMLDELVKPPSWPKWFDRRGQEFIRCWQQSSRRFKVSTHYLFYHFLEQEIDQTLTDEQLRNTDCVMDMGTAISSMCSMNANVQALLFLYQQGFKAPRLPRSRFWFYRELAQLTDDQDRAAIVDLCNSPLALDHDQNDVDDLESYGTNVLSKFHILKNCCEIGHKQNIVYYLGKFTDCLDQPKINCLFDSASSPYLIKVLYSHGFKYTDVANFIKLYKHCWLDKFSQQQVTTVLACVDPERKKWLLTQLLHYTIQKNDSVSFQHFVCNNRIQLDLKDNDLINIVSKSTNINIIDYINKNQTLLCSHDCNDLEAMISHARDMDCFFGRVFDRAIHYQFNIALINYLAQEDCVEPEMVKPLENGSVDLLSIDNFVLVVFNLYHFIYLLHNPDFIEKSNNRSLSFVKHINNQDGINKPASSSSSISQYLSMYDISKYEFLNASRFSNLVALLAGSEDHEKTIHNRDDETDKRSTKKQKNQ